MVASPSVDDTPDKNVDDVNLDDKSKKEENEQTVKHSSYVKVVDKLKDTERRFAELEKTIKKIEQEKAAAELKKAEDEGNLQKILELREATIAEKDQTIADLIGQRDGLRDDVVVTKKLQAFYDKMPGKIKRSEFLNFVDLDSIIIDSESGTIDSQSVDVTVNKFMEKYSDLVDTSHVTKLPGDAAGGGGSLPTVENFKDLPLDEMKKQGPGLVQALKKKHGL